MPLTKTDGFYDYGYRLSIDARDSVSYLRVHVHVETTAPLGDVLLPGHSDLAVVRNGLHTAEAFLNQTRPTPTSDLQIRFRAAGASLSQFPEVNGDRYVRFSLDATDPAFASSIRPTPRALLILVDGSGSMGFLDRWALAKDAVRRIARDLRPGESYGAAVFHGATVTTFFPALQTWTPATDGDLIRFLDTFRPHGSTGLATPLAQADSWAVDARRMGQEPIVVLISDGRPTRSPLDPDLETAYSRISYDREMPIFAMAVQPADHADETVLHSLSHYHGGDLVTIFGDVSSPVRRPPRRHPSARPARRARGDSQRGQPDVREGESPGCLAGRRGGDDRQDARDRERFPRHPDDLAGRLGCDAGAGYPICRSRHSDPAAAGTSVGAYASPCAPGGRPRPSGSRCHRGTDDPRDGKPRRDPVHVAPRPPPAAGSKAVTGPRPTRPSPDLRCSARPRSRLRRAPAGPSFSSLHSSPKPGRRMRSGETSGTCSSCRTKSTATSRSGLPSMRRWTCRRRPPGTRAHTSGSSTSAGSLSACNVAFPIPRSSLRAASDSLA